MQAVMGSMNGVWLQNIVNASTGKVTRITAAVAYASAVSPFIDHCIQNKTVLDFFGLLDEDCAVTIPVLERLLEAGPMLVTPRLIKGHFHSKIIWWHGFGAYVGSANLTHSAWSTNVECGVFFDESEIVGTQLQVDLETQINYLRLHSTPVTRELVRSLGALRSFTEQEVRAKRKTREKFEELTKGIKSHAGLTGPSTNIKTDAFVRFTSEWSETLELLRGLRADFLKLGARPSWVASTADPTVHFDQFLHAYYYARIRDDQDKKENAESAKSSVLVQRAFERNRANRTAALEEAAEWWAALPAAPYQEDIFISSTAPFLKKMLALERLRTWTLDEAKSTLYEVHAFKTHARQMRNSFYGLPAGFHESERAKSDRLAAWLFTQDREGTRESFASMLQFLIWGNVPGNPVERLWLAITEQKWRFDHCGASSLGEALGWARPEDYPPRNNRTNKALRSLGHDVTLFSE